jgi:D-amino-acid oxidase
MDAVRVSVIGSGVIGLSCAHEIARAGHEVVLVSDGDLLDQVSAVAGGLWFPYRALPLDRVVPWGLRTLDRLTGLADDPATGVRLVEGVMVDHAGDDRPWWTEGVPGVRRARPDELPPGAPAGHVCRVPLVSMRTYLPWLADTCRRLGVRPDRRHVERIGDVDADLVVVAAGLRSGLLTGDSDLTPIRGQVVRVADPGLARWVVDSGPGGTAYVLPHGDHVVCGGSDEEGEWDTTPDPDLERAILRRCAELVPEVAGAEVVSRAVGLRPGAPSVRLDRHVIHERDVVTCYGHGGAGVTLSWGCAEEVAEVVGT